MLASASASVSGLFTAPLKARNQTRSIGSVGRVRDGLGIAPLRATGSSPGVLSSAVPARSALVAPSASGKGVLSQFQGQVRSVSPLTAGVRSSHRLQPASSSGVMQSRQTGLMDRMRRVDTGSRLLQANANPLRAQGGFGIRPITTGISLFG